MKLGKKGKLRPSYIGSFEVLQRIGGVAYYVGLPQALLAFITCFELSMLRKYEPNPSHVIGYKLIALPEDTTNIEKPIRILDC